MTGSCTKASWQKRCGNGHMSRARRLKERILPKALVCGMLEDRGRVLFLKIKDRQGTERLEMPCLLLYSGDPVSQLTEAFREQTGIDGEVGGMALETRHNAGSRKRKRFIPCLVFRIRAKGMKTRPAPQFSGYRWLSLEDAKKEKPGRNAKWITMIGR